MVVLRAFPAAVAAGGGAAPAYISSPLLKKRSRARALISTCFSLRSPFFLRSFNDLRLCAKKMNVDRRGYICAGSFIAVLGEAVAFTFPYYARLFLTSNAWPDFEPISRPILNLSVPVNKSLEGKKRERERERKEKQLLLLSSATC